MDTASTVLQALRKREGDPTFSTVLAKCSPLPVGAIVLGSGYYTDISEFRDHDLEVAKRRARIHEDVNFAAYQNLTQNRQAAGKALGMRSPPRKRLGVLCALVWCAMPMGGSGSCDVNNDCAASGGSFCSTFFTKHCADKSSAFMCCGDSGVTPGTTCCKNSCCWQEPAAPAPTPAPAPPMGGSGNCVVNNNCNHRAWCEPFWTDKCAGSSDAFFCCGNACDKCEEGMQCCSDSCCWNAPQAAPESSTSGGITAAAVASVGITVAAVAGGICGCCCLVGCVCMCMKSSASATPVVPASTAAPAPTVSAVTPASSAPAIVIGASELPGYWQHQDIGEHFNEWCEVPQKFLAQLQQLLDVTWKGKSTRDRTGQMPTGVRLVKAHRVENLDLWQKYVGARKQLARKRPDGVVPVNMLDGDPLSGFVKTSEVLDPDYLDRLITPLNELYLWHGTSPEGAVGISKDGFRFSNAGKHGLMFGLGAYMAECCSKSDEYASDQKGGLYQGMYALLLCRVLCGEMFRVTQANSRKIESAMATGDYDSVLGDREASVGTYREFVVPAEDRIYPEYVIIYERVYASS